MFDTVAAAESLRRPAVILPRRGWFWSLLRVLGFGVPPKKYVGRILSHLEWQQFSPRILDMGAGNLDPVEASKVLVEYCDAIGIPWDRLQHLPDGVLEEVISDFFVCQGAANSRRKIRPTSGNSSPGKDSAAPNE